MPGLRTRHAVPVAEVQWVAVRAQGPGGQNVNKVATAVQLRFDIPRSSLPEALKARLLASRDHRLTQEGVLVIKAQSARTQERNRAEAMARLQAWVDEASYEAPVRKPTKPTLGSRQRRLQAKQLRGELKATRGPWRP